MRQKECSRCKALKLEIAFKVNGSVCFDCRRASKDKANDKKDIIRAIKRMPYEVAIDGFK